MSATGLLIQHLGEVLTVPVSGQVPNPRPGRFITVERTSGGERDRVLETPVWAVQVWAESDYEADKLTVPVREAIRAFPAYLIHITNVYNFPDPDSRQSRVQIVVEATVRV